MNFKKILFLTIFSLFAFKSYAQISVTSYSTQAIGLNTSKAKSFSGELKTFTNREFDDLWFEFAGFYNFKPKEYHQFSVGLAYRVAFQEDYAFTIPVQLAIYPIQDKKQFSIIFELASIFEIEGSTSLRSLWGIRYTFGQAKKK